MIAGSSPILEASIGSVQPTTFAIRTVQIIVPPMDNATDCLLYTSFQVLVFHHNKSVCKTDNSCFIQCLWLSDSSMGTDLRQWEKCCTTEFILFQKFNHTFCCLFVICNNILDTTAKSRLNGCLIFFLYFNNCLLYTSCHLSFLNCINRCLL